MSTPANLTYVMPHGDSLQRWDRDGLFNLQLSLVRAFQNRGMQISLVSFGGRDEYEYLPRLSGMKILCNWTGLPMKTYARRLHQVHASQLLKSDLVQTADAPAIVEALRISWAWQIPLVYRFGFVLSSLRRRTLPNDILTIERLEGMERKGLSKATRVIAPTAQIADDMSKMVPNAAPRLSVIPNFVDTDNFRPIPREKSYDLVYVGRLTYVKNVGALLEAVDRLGLTIAVIGGPLSQGRDSTYDESHKLKERFGDLNGRIHWLDRMKNEDLPNYINQAKAFVICSYSEGHARTMIEAMACGMPVIGTNVPEIKNTLRHEVTGYICNTDADSLAQAIETVLSKPTLLKKMGENARSYALEHYSLTQLAQREYDLLQEVARSNPVGSAPKRVAQYLFRQNPPLV